MRFKNYGLWVAFAALVGLFVNDLGLLAPEQYDQYVNAVLAVLIAAGIINNPSNGKGYGDK
ncbi:MAG TPA: holin [Metabacillus sp.]|nr:holin [Metabacillus sp.]